MKTLIITILVVVTIILFVICLILLSPVLFYNKCDQYLNNVKITQLYQENISIFELYKSYDKNIIDIKPVEITGFTDIYCPGKYSFQIEYKLNKIDRKTENLIRDNFSGLKYFYILNKN